MPDWTDPGNLSEHFREVGKEKQLQLIETERKPKLTEAEAKYLDLIERLKAWQEREKAEKENPA